MFNELIKANENMLEAYKACNEARDSLEEALKGVYSHLNSVYDEKNSTLNDTERQTVDELLRVFYKDISRWYNMDYCMDYNPEDSRNYVKTMEENYNLAMLILNK